MEELMIEEERSRKIYSVNLICVGTFLGGPLTAGYLLGENFKTLGQKENVRPTWIITITVTALTLGGISMIPGSNKISNLLIPLIYTAITYCIAYGIQGNKIKTYILETNEVFSVWRSLRVGLIWAVITIIPISLTQKLLTDPTLTEATKSYGKLKHEIYFNKSTLLETEVDQIAEALIVNAFFDNEQRKEIRLEKNNDTFLISIPVTKDACKDKEAVEYFTNLRLDIQAFFRYEKVVICLSYDDIVITKFI